MTLAHQYIPRRSPTGPLGDLVVALDERREESLTGPAARAGSRAWRAGKERGARWRLLREH